ncbi:hypothetical protein Pmani_016578 [Petrolisthes manimaculis]|uniref:Uncharacterized protein n=1 Tax=Petrolisthes manimaculis TaxID=1843537 RepID=A0AAE1PRY5_9EUCA|nr:hypothetical protein Pmani_016578 [Petrolisthes manimaculis]
MSQVTVTAAAYLVIRNARKTRKRKHRWWKKEVFIGNVTAHNDFLGRRSTPGNRLNLVECGTLHVNMLKCIACHTAACYMLPPVEPVESHLGYATVLHATCCQNVASVEYRLK